MNIPLFISYRYFFAKKSNLVNKVSRISTISIAVSIAALVIVLSVFNGISALVFNMYQGFDPDLKIIPSYGKTFFTDEVNIDSLKNIDGVDVCIPELTDIAMIKYGESQIIASVKGITDDYNKIIGKNITGKFALGATDTLRNIEKFFCVPGIAIAENLGINIYSPTPIFFYAPVRGENPVVPYIQQSAQPIGTFQTIAEYDSKYVLSSLSFAQQLFGIEDEISSINIILTAGYNSDKIDKQIQQFVGDDFKVLTAMQLHDFYFKTVKSERLLTILILSFVLLISTFNMLSSLMLIISDKSKDISTLSSMGTTKSTIRKIFLMEGLWISLSGGIIGLLIGIGLTLLQQYFGLIKFGAEGDYVVSAYPVILKITDVFIIFAINVFTALITSLLSLFKLRKISINR